MASGSTRRCINPISFTALLGASVFIYIGSIGPYTVGILTTMQRQFQLKSSEVGIVLSINDIVSLLLVTPVAYISTPRHRPRILGVLTIFFAIGCLLCALPQFTANTPTTTKPISTTPTNRSEEPDVVVSNPFFQSASICEIDDDDGEVNEDCSEQELEASGAQFGSLVWFLVGQGFIGLGSTGYWTLGLTYMDDGLPSKTAASLYVASMFMMVSVSPIAAFALSGFALSLHTNFYKIDVDELGYGAKDPRWIGAWWIGYIIYGLVMGLLCIPYFFYPKKWPERIVDVDDLNDRNMKGNKVNEEDEDEPSAAFLIKNNIPDPESSCSGMITGYFSAVRRLATNMTYLSMVISSIADSIMFSGFFSFLGRYLQTQYDITPSMTSIILGCATSPSAVLGNMIGGILLKRLKLSLKGMAGTILIVGSFTLVIFGMFFVVACETSPIAGLNTPYPDGTETIGSQAPIASCMSGCSCPVGVYTPVCGSDGITYITPCHAGCRTQAVDEVTEQTVYSNCSCIVPDTIPTTSAYDSYGGNTAVLEKCSAPCSAKRYAFIFLLALMMLMYSFLNVPGFMLFMRSVENKDKAVALAFSSLLQKVLAFIPAPIAFGAAIQTTCIMFQESCGTTGNCLVYDNIRLARVLIGLVFIFKVMALVMSTICFFTIRRNESGEYQYLQLCQAKRDDSESTELALTHEELTLPYYPYETRV